MYLIIDNNVTHLLAPDTSRGITITEDAKAILLWLSKYGKAVTGGQLLREYAGENGNRRFVSLFNQLRAAGRAMNWPDDEVDTRTADLLAQQACRSNDAHVIALAQVSGARALWTLDQALRRDFKDRALVDRPRGALYFPEGSARRRLAGIRAITRVCRQG